MILLGCACAALVLPAGTGQSPGEAFSSEYTPLTQPPCKTRSVQIEGANSEQACPGMHGYKLLLLDSDGRMSVTIIGPDGARHPLEFWNTVTSHFSAVGKRAEWRIQKHGTQMTPVGVILPLKINEDPDSGAVTPYLVVARIDSAKVCVVQKFRSDASGLVEARKTADSSREMDCLTQ